MAFVISFMKCIQWYYVLHVIYPSQSVYAESNNCAITLHYITWLAAWLVGGVAQWLGCRSVAGGLSLICA